MSKLEDMVNWAVSIANDDSHGYDQIERWGTDYDCSSLVISAAKKAGYDVGGATYTGNMTSNFVKAGFTKITNINKRKRGDILLNVKHHTAIYLGDDKLVHASINENGKISGGKKGDQTGREICIRSYYDYPWDCILRPPTESKTSVPDQKSSSSKKTVYVNEDSYLNVRAGAGTGYAAIGKLYRGETVEVISESNNWSEIRFNNKKAFVCSSYLK